MLLYTLLAFAAAPSVLAQKTISVMVGENGGLTYTPNSVTAQKGDIIQLSFLAKNHTFTQSSFKDPCTPLPSSSNGFDSGFQAVKGPGSPLQVNYNVSDDLHPLWFYCKQVTPDHKTHCGQGMVFAINANANATFEAFQATANATGASSPAPSGSGAGTSGTPASGTASPPAASSTSGAMTNIVRLGSTLLGVAMVATSLGSHVL